ncbi:MAG TPA: DUF881 domain-containing protein [Candidatus Avipropionibacterium avicola]|uniref:DUF881 domain-containing protein n=1 Tax=Candidatus Avipropionibacterium avicola TaxID=2840701 RepID=A0A9D1GZZ9_9ACTN|nr:DUF881 domain-containing protein [Candidatus Avipropionibacterium avicola]
MPRRAADDTRVEASTPPNRSPWAVLKRLVRSRRKERHVPLKSRLMTGLVCMLAGLMIVASAMVARGVDLRPDRNTDLVDLLDAEKARNAQLAEQVARMRSEVDELTARRQSTSGSSEAAELQERGALVPVSGPAVTITLTDAPADFHPAGVDDDALVVHQQDIQAVANALWAGGAEAMTIQGQRVVSTTGIKCVGNVVVLHGVPYAPPYVITAIGDPTQMLAAVDSSRYIEIYKQYVDAYGLGWKQQSGEQVRLPAYDGPLSLDHARVPG